MGITAGGDGGLTHSTATSPNMLANIIAIAPRLNPPQDARRLKKKVNLKFQAARMRDTMSDEQAYEASALFTHFAPEFQAKLTQPMWAQLVQKFTRGGLDHELSEKIAHKDPKIMVESFRFLQTCGAEVVQRSGGPAETWMRRRAPPWMHPRRASSRL